MLEAILLLGLLLQRPGASVVPVSTCPACVLDPQATTRAERLMRRLQQDLGITRAAAAAVAAHALAESNIEGVDERLPVVRHSRGGIGYLQWTGEGPDGRRSNFEAYAKVRRLDPHSDEASILFFEHELTTRFPAILQALRDPTRSAGAQARTLQPYVFGLDPRLNAKGALRAATAERLAAMPATPTTTAKTPGPARL